MNRETEHFLLCGLKTSIPLFFFFFPPTSLEIVAITKHPPCCTNLYIHKQQLHTYKYHHSKQIPHLRNRHHNPVHIWSISTINSRNLQRVPCPAVQVKRHTRHTRYLPAARGHKGNPLCDTIDSDVCKSLCGIAVCVPHPNGGPSRGRGGNAVKGEGITCRAANVANGGGARAVSAR